MLELVAAEDQVELEEDVVVEEEEVMVVDVDVEVEVHVDVDVGVVEDDEHAFAGAVPSAHFSSPSAIPEHTSSAEIRFPSSS